VNSRTPEKPTSLGQLRFQAFSSMAFGAENIIWACYTAGWWHNQVLDDKGEKTEQYDKLKTVNGEIKALADEYMKYRTASTHFVGFENVDGFDTVNQEGIKSLDTGVFTEVTSDAPIIVGEMASRTYDGSNALFVFAADDPDDVNHKTVNVTFKCRRVPAVTGEAELAYDGECYTLTLESNGAALITA
nr:hypothetical protein [Clostridia bacterium]